MFALASCITWLCSLEAIAVGEPWTFRSLSRDVEALLVENSLMESGGSFIGSLVCRKGHSARPYRDVV